MLLGTDGGPEEILVARERWIIGYLREAAVAITVPLLSRSVTEKQFDWQCRLGVASSPLGRLQLYFFFVARLRRHYVDNSRLSEVCACSVPPEADRTS